jgi:heme/copper-type cytochrome/quinol oxidase subunit 2
MAVPRNGRIAIVLAMLALVAGMVVFVAMAFVASNPPTVDFATGHKPGQPVNLVIQTVGTIGFGPHPTWVSYLVRDPQGQWVHTTLWALPEHTRINVTDYQYDTGSPLRNQVWGRVTGTIGDTMTVTGKTMKVINSYAGTAVAHTFTVPALNIDVPLMGNKTSPKICSHAPCDPSVNAHHIVKFSFMTPGVGQYHWQCFIPCGAGFLYGNGGPMSTIGYMGGFLKVIA